MNKYYILNEDYEITYRKKYIFKNSGNSIMKQLITCIAMFVFCLSKTYAQPSNENVISHFKKNGVTAVNVINTVKEWDSKETKYYWKVSLVKTQPVPPADVDGLTGVTLETHVVADYDMGSQSPYWSGVTFSEYKGINLPTPSNEDLTAMLVKLSAADPNKFFRSSSGKISLDKVWTDDAQCEWINLKKLSFKGMMIFKEDVSYTEIAEIQSQIAVTLIRSSLKSEWNIDNVYQYVESQSEIKRINKSDAGSNAMSMSDRAIENNNKIDATRLQVPTPPKYTTAESLAYDLIIMLHNLSKEQMDYYIIQMFSPEFKCTGCTFTPNNNGYNRDMNILQSAYDGAVQFKDAYCMEPKIAIEGNAAYFKDKNNSLESNIMMDKIGEYYYLNSANLKISSDASIKNINCNEVGNTSGNVNNVKESMADIMTIPGNKWKVGDNVMVEENGSWYPSTILEAKVGNKYFIHYDGYASSYDLWVGKDRIKDK